MKTLTRSRLPVAYADEGRGKTIILAHCSGVSHRMWRGLIEGVEERLSNHRAGFHRLWRLGRLAGG